MKVRIVEKPVEKPTGEKGPISDEQKAARRKAVDRAFASIAIDGGHVADYFVPIFDRYVNGDLTLEEMGAALDALTDQKRQERDERQKQSA